MYVNLHRDFDLDCVFALLLILYSELLLLSMVSHPSSEIFYLFQEMRWFGVGGNVAEDESL